MKISLRDGTWCIRFADEELFLVRACVIEPERVWVVSPDVFTRVGSTRVDVYELWKRLDQLDATTGGLSECLDLTAEDYVLMRACTREALANIDDWEFHIITGCERLEAERLFDDLTDLLKECFPATMLDD